MSIRPDPDSLVTRAVAAVNERGTATLDDLQALFPGVSRKSLRETMTRAVGRGLLRNVVKPSPSRAAVYGPVLSKATQERIVRVSSVWGLASEPAAILALPGRRYEPLGPWRSEE